MLQYFQFPKFLLKLRISQTAKFLYMILYDRARISRMNSWIDKYGIFIKCTQSLTADEQGVYHFAVQPYSTVTVTSLEVADSAEHTQKLPVEGKRTVLDTDRTGDVQNTEDAYLYADDFEYKGKTVPVLDGKGGFTGETQDYITVRGGKKALWHVIHIR